MFRFTIRDVLWLMVVVAMGIGWWLDKRALTMARTQKDAAVKITEALWRSNEEAQRANREYVLLLQSQIDSLQKTSPDKN